MSTSASSWHYSPSHTGIADYSPLLKKYTYQLSSFTGSCSIFVSDIRSGFLTICIGVPFYSEVSPTGTSGVDESTSTKSPAKIKGRDIWQQLRITDEDLLEYNEKFRLWLSSTVLQPLKGEIQRINESLTAHGLADARIGKIIYIFFKTFFRRWSRFSEISQFMKTVQTLSRFFWGCWSPVEIDEWGYQILIHQLILFIDSNDKGECSLEKLRKTCQLAPVATNIPSLVEVLPYLEVTSHQDYLVRCLNGLYFIWLSSFGN